MFRWPYYMLWGMYFPPETYFLIAAFNFMYLFPTQWVKRISTQNGLQPTGTVPSAIAYSLMYTWASTFANFPIMLLDPNNKTSGNQDQKTETAVIKHDGHQVIPENLATCESNLKNN